MDAHDEQFKFADLAKAKADARAQDEADIASGRRSRDEVKRQNEHFAALKVRVLLDPSTLV